MTPTESGVHDDPGLGASLLSVLIVDDEPPAIDELRYLLTQEPLIGDIQSAGCVVEAVRLLKEYSFDALFLDIEMPGMTGLELARQLAATGSKRGSPSPHIVFVTAYEEHAVSAFEVDALDYVLKPVRADRLSQAVRRISSASYTAKPEGELARIPVESAGRTVFVERSQVEVVEASRDYVKLHTAEKGFLVRMPISTIESSWAQYGFVRVHRSYIVAVSAVRELRSDNSGTTILVGNLEVPVSRTYARDLKQRLAGERR